MFRFNLGLQSKIKHIYVKPQVHSSWILYARQHLHLDVKQKREPMLSFLRVFYFICSFFIQKTRLPLVIQALQS